MTSRERKRDAAQETGPEQDARPRPRVLIVDDDEAFAADIAMVVGREAEVRRLVDPDEALALYRQGWPDAVLLDIEFPEHDGIEVLQEMQAGDASIPVVMLTSHTGIPLVVAAMRAGAVNFVAKSQSPPEIVLETLRHALRQSGASRHLSYLQDRLDDIKGTGHTQVLGESAATLRLREDLELAARADLDVLLLGETGTGKELAARWIHQNSRRGRGPFVAEDLCSIPETLLASALFGHEKGAFTGAVSRRVGAFEAARGGTLMLDEIGEIPLTMQASLLRVLQNREVHRLGADPAASVACDVRVIAATHQDLEALVSGGDFREDLYYRLRVLAVRMPPLRERREDIPALVLHFLEKHQVATGTPVETVDDAAMALLQEHHWPGNIRDLEHTLQEALIRSRGRVLDRALVERILGGGEAGEDPAAVATEDGAFPTYHEARQRTMTRWQRGYLLEALDRADNVVNQAARLVDISPNSFRNMMRKLGIARQGDTSR